MRMYREETGRPIVELAHMEISEPSIEVAFARCVEQGATLVAVSPFFLSPGRHWQEVLSVPSCLVLSCCVVRVALKPHRHTISQTLAELCTRPSLSPSHRTTQDIPTLTAAAASKYPAVGYFVAAPLGLHPLMTTIVDSRLETCLAHLTAGGMSSSWHTRFIPRKFRSVSNICGATQSSDASCACRWRL